MYKIFRKSDLLERPALFSASDKPSTEAERTLDDGLERDGVKIGGRLKRIHINDK